MTNLNPALESTTRRIVERSQPARTRYLDHLEKSRPDSTHRATLSCTNLAHAFAASPDSDKIILRAERQPNLAIVTAYNDMLSAHQPYEQYPEQIKAVARKRGATAQVAGGTPAMCDGITQGQPGMELSLFSRDTIALSTAVALSHNVFDAAVYLGICDKIVPGLLMGALAYGHLPALFIPAGPMTTGLANADKALTRQRFAMGEATREELLESECRSYHGPGTCTFYGTANSNQMLLEVMGLLLPGSAFVNPGTDIRSKLTEAATETALSLTVQSNNYKPVGRIVDERTIVNAIVGLMATGGSTNHTLHLVAIARAAGITIDWQDFHALSEVVPLLTNIYPNGKADINQFQAAGGMALVIRELLDNGLLHEDVTTVVGDSLRDYTREPWLDGSNGEPRLNWRDGAEHSPDSSIIRSARSPFSNEGGLKLLEGNLGRSVIKCSAVKPEHQVVEAKAIVFDSQQALMDAFDRGELERDFVAVIRFQGPRANGMPELHKLTPVLGVLQDKGFQVGLVTDGRMSGATGKIPAAIHVCPEAVCGGPLSRVKTGDTITLDAIKGKLDVMIDEAEWSSRDCVTEPDEPATIDYGTLLFAGMRHLVGEAESGACSLTLAADD